MKKRSYILLAAALAAVMMFAGCNNKEQENSGNTENADADNAGGASDDVLDFKVSDYVKLGEYKGLEVTYPSVLEVTDEDVEEQIQYELEDNTEYKEIKDRGAQEGDYVNMDFKGTVDGEEFDGGTASDYELELGAGEFLEEFESNLIGKKVGETAIFKLTFPEDYDDTLGGKEAEFTVTINSISEAVAPEYNEDFVKSVSDFKTLKEYEASVKKQLELDAKDASVMEAQENALKTAIENATVDGYPQKLYDFFYDDTVTGYKNYAEFMGMEYEEFLESYMSEEEINAMVDEQVNEYLVVRAILEKEGKEISDSEYQELAEKLAKENDYETLEEYEEDYGKIYVKTQLARDRVVELLYDAAKLKEVPYEEYHANDELEWEDEGEDSEGSDDLGLDLGDEEDSDGLELDLGDGDDSEVLENLAE
ncbi:MAG: trigger factor [Lachnospiraceae bacterium]|nr:trigger factor [Lachnospiraceae bacterium]